jgi:hypothetical protein
MREQVKKIEEYLARMDWQNERLEETVWRTGVRTKFKDFDILVFLENGFLCINLLFGELPAQNQERVLQELLRINFKRYQGSFCINEKDCIFVAASLLMEKLDFEEFEMALCSVCEAAEENFLLVANLIDDVERGISKAEWR